MKKNTITIILVIIIAVLAYLSWNGIKVSSERESSLEAELSYSNERIIAMRVMLEKDSILLSQLNDSIKEITYIKDSLYLINLKQDSIYENKIDSIINLSTDSIANYIRGEITRRFFETKTKRIIVRN